MTSNSSSLPIALIVGAASKISPAVLRIWMLLFWINPPVRNDIAGTLGRMQPRCQRYRDGSLKERLVSELEGAPVHPDGLFAPNLLVDPHGVFRRDVLRESGGRWSE